MTPHLPCDSNFYNTLWARVIHHLNVIWPQFWRLSHPEKDKKSRNWISNFKQNGKLQKYFLNRHTLFLLKNILLHFSCDADRWYQIKSIWIWNVNLYKKDFHYSPIINKTVPQSQAYSSSENITHMLCMNLCLMYLEFAFSLFCSFVWLSHQTNAANPNWLKCCKL